MLASITDTQAAATFDKDTMKKLGEFAKTTKNSTVPAVSEIRTKLVELYGPNVDGTAGAAANLNRTIAAAVAKKVRLLSRGSDPFLRKLRFKKGTKSKATPNVRTTGKGRRTYVSLGKLLMIFVGAPLATTRQFDEVQFVFYGFNSKASYMHDFNIAQFPIHIETFKEKFDQLKKTTANIPITQFVEFINKEFLSTQDTNAYGLVHTFTDGDNTEKRKDWFNKGTRLADEINRILKDAYNSAEISPEFVLPFMKMSIETVPVNYKTQSDDTAGTSVERTILRIHLMDSAASSNDGLLEMFTLVFGVKRSQFLNAPVVDFLIALGWLRESVSNLIQKEYHALKSNPDPDMQAAGVERLSVFAEMNTLIAIAQQYGKSPQEIETWPYNMVFSLMLHNKILGEVQKNYSEIKSKAK